MTIGKSIVISLFVTIWMLCVSILFELLQLSIHEELLSFITYICTLGIPAIVLYVLRTRKLGGHGWNLSLSPKRILLWIALGTVGLLWGVVDPVSSLLPMPEAMLESLTAFAQHKGVFIFLSMVVLAPLCEEIIFRGIILDGLLKKYSPVIAIIVSSVLFGAVHLNPWQFVTGLVLGIFMGWVYYRTKNLTMAILMHAVANFTGYVSRFFIDPEEGSFLLVVVAAAIGVFSVVMLHREFLRDTA